MSARLVWQANGGRAFLEGRKMRKLRVRPEVGFDFEFIEYSDDPDVAGLKVLRGERVPLTLVEQALCLLWLREFFEMQA
jgi:hypothetical protein